jgi:predicted O-linked N-acetylglucosamine transferase (SPINDLY family)
VTEIPDDELARARAEVARHPADAEAQCRLGNALQEHRQVDEAVAAFNAALNLQPASPEVHYNLANALSAGSRFDEAVNSYRSALKLRPIYPDAYNNLGNCLHRIGRIDEAVAAFHKAIVCQPRDPLTYNNLGNALKDSAQIEKAVHCFGQAMTLDPLNPLWASHRLYAMHFHPGVDATTLLRAHLDWDRQHAEHLRQNLQPHDNDRRKDRRLRIGYVSPNFREHVVGRNLLPLLREHDRHRFEIYCYSNSHHEDALTARFQSLADGWRNITDLDDDQAAEQIRADRIDILLDLSLHMAGNRLLLFARKPAPVQATFAGYPSGTGLATMDYRLTDPYLDPAGQADNDYRERSIRLAQSFWCFDPTGDEPEVGPPPFQNHGGRITFGCLNNFSKVNDRVLSLWGRVLKAAPDSRMLLIAPAGSARERTLAELKREGVEESRIEFVDRQPRRNYLELYHRIDLALDTSPYNGHTTNLEGLWMGVPAVTRVGQTAVSRAGLSQLSNIGLSKLAAFTDEQFIQIAAELANNPAELTTLRADLRERMRGSALNDSRQFALAIETAYQSMWDDWCAAGS